jgi:putative alpha-1,2-mannosidase
VLAVLVAEDELVNRLRAVVEAVIQVQGGLDDRIRTFYRCLYRCLMSPNKF